MELDASLFINDTKGGSVSPKNDDVILNDVIIFHNMKSPL